MTGGTADALALVGVLAVFGTVAIVARRIFESRGPHSASHWSEREFGDQPEVPVFHSPSIVPEAQRDHV